MYINDDYLRNSTFINVISCVLNAVQKPYKFLYKLDVDANTTIVDDLVATPTADEQVNIILKSFDRTVVLTCASAILLLLFFMYLRCLLF